MYSNHNLSDLFTLIGSVSGHELVKTPYYDFIFSPGYIWPNKLLNLRVNAGNAIAILDELETDIAQKDMPGILMFDPAQHDDDLLDIILLRNYKSSTWTAMSHQLQDIPFIETTELKIEVVSDDAQLVQWVQLVEAELMHMPSLNFDMFQYLLHQKNCTFLLGLIHEIPVATALLFVSNDIGGAYLIATSNKYRNKGYGGQITSACLTMAKGLKCKKVDLQATDMGKNMYQSIGFENCGSIHNFKIEKAG